MKDKIPPCTTVKQSRLLVQVGIDPNTADMVYYLDHGELLLPTAHLLSSRPKHDIPDWNDETFLPAWSLTALLNILPDDITYAGEDEVTFLDARTYALSIEPYRNKIRYVGDNPSDIKFDSGLRLNLLDAAVEVTALLAREGFFDEYE